MNNPHPYRKQPLRAFWSKAVSPGLQAADLITVEPLIRAGETVASAGSCFAANIVAPLENAGFTYLRTHRRHPAFLSLEPERFSYDEFSAAYGNIYTARQLLQLFRRSVGTWRPREDRWHVGGRVIDPYRPGLRYTAGSDTEFDLLNQQHLGNTRAVFEQADVFVFTLGLTEAWSSRADGAVFPAAPGTVAGLFDEESHTFVNFSVADVVADLKSFIAEVRVINPDLRLILSVSPVPLVATATEDHVLVASTYSKSVLRAAAGEVCSSETGVTYFPAYEIVTGPQSDMQRFEEDRRSPTKEAIGEVMSILLACCEEQRIPNMAADGPKPMSAELLSQAIADAECEEAMSDRLHL